MHPENLVAITENLVSEPPHTSLLLEPQDVLGFFFGGLLIGPNGVEHSSHSHQPLWKLTGIVLSLPLLIDFQLGEQIEGTLGGQGFWSVDCITPLYEGLCLSRWVFLIDTLLWFRFGRFYRKHTHHRHLLLATLLENLDQG